MSLNEECVTYKIDSTFNAASFTHSNKNTLVYAMHHLITENQIKHKTANKKIQVQVSYFHTVFILYDAKQPKVLNNIIALVSQDILQIKHKHLGKELY